MSPLDFVAWSNYRLGIILAADCLAPYQKALFLGLTDLQRGMETAEPYDHDKPKGDYGKKNEYFNRANNIGVPFLEKGITGISKIYYSKMLDAINEYEKKNNKPLNKGMVCGNLGVSALTEGDIDGGIAYLLWADHEDRGWLKDPNRIFIFESRLYTQFAKDKSPFGGQPPLIMMETAINKYNTDFKDNVSINDVFKELEGSPEHRALLEGSLWVIHRNLVLLREERERGIYVNKNNVYTRLRLFDGIVSLCRFIELRMRNYEKASGTLGNLLECVFGCEAWFEDVKSRNKSPQKPKDFNDRVKEALKVNRPGKNILILWILRNYATHICDPEVPFFFENFENIFHEVIIAYIYYLKFKKLV